MLFPVFTIDLGQAVLKIKLRISKTSQVTQGFVPLYGVFDFFCVATQGSYIYFHSEPGIQF